MPSLEPALTDADAPSWHGREAIGVFGIATVSLVAAITTHEFHRAWPYYLASLVVVVVAWILLRQRPARPLLLVWPVLVLAGLSGADLAAPKAAGLCVGAIVLAFLSVGLTQPRWTSLYLWPLAALVWIQINDLPIEQAIVRGVLATLVWIAAAELPAWLTGRITRAQVRLAEMARTDPLTGLANRRWWQQTLDALEREATMSVLLIDLDHFKRFNDEHGHIAGDGLLVAFADALRDAIRIGDLAARWGGEEFAIALPALTGPEARAVADRVLAAVPEGQSCSIGLAERQVGENADSLMRRVDEALYRAKNGGRNCVVAV